LETLETFSRLARALRRYPESQVKKFLADRNVEGWL
jgi:hypothetical protein